MRWIYAGRFWLEEWKRKSLDKYKVAEIQKWSLQRQRQLLGMDKSAKKQEIYRIRKWGEDSLGKKFVSLFTEYNLQRLQSKQEVSNRRAEEMKQQQRMAIMKDLIKKIRSKGSMDAQNRW